MVFDVRDQRLKLCIQGNRCATQNEVVEILTLIGKNTQPGVHILIDEDVIKNNEIRKSSIPSVVLKYSWWRPSGALNHNMRRVLSSESPALIDR